MKMVKSLLLGTAAGLVAMAGAQALDLSAMNSPAYTKVSGLDIGVTTVYQHIDRKSLNLVAVKIDRAWNNRNSIYHLKQLGANHYKALGLAVALTTGQIDLTAGGIARTSFGLLGGFVATG